MKKLQNESKTDRIVRFILGAILIIVSNSNLTGGVQTVGYIAGIVLLFTSLTGFCLIYKIFNFKTK